MRPLPALLAPRVPRTAHPTPQEPGRPGLVPASRGAFRSRALAACAAAAVVGGVLVAPSPARAAQYTHAVCRQQVADQPLASADPEATVMDIGSMSQNLARTYTPADDEPTASFANGFAWDTVGSDGKPTRSVLTMFDQSPDTADAPKTPVSLTSSDGGRTFPASTRLEPAHGKQMAQLRSGRIIGLDYKPTGSGSDGAQLLPAYRSDDDGKTWTSYTASFYGAQSFGTDGWVRIFGDPYELPDGSILQTYYGQYVKDGPWFSGVARSTDGGVTFQHHADFTTGMKPTPSEATIARRADGALIAAIRIAVPNEGDVLYWSSSSDEGGSWSTPVPMRISKDGAAAPALTRGVTPTLLTMPNGAITLTSGRWDNYVAISTTGGPDDWTARSTYRNCPATSNVSVPTHGSTGNGGSVRVSDNRMIVFGDNCQKPNFCTPTDTDYTVSDEPFTWRRYVDVVGPGTGKIDLAGKLAAGRIHVSGNMDRTVRKHPRSGAAAALDGSTDYWSSAVHTGKGAGEYIVALDGEYHLSKAQLSLHRNLPSSAVVSTSMDGVTWTRARQVSTSSYALATADLGSVTARYVKVSVDPTADCDAGLGAQCAFLGELELYSADVDSFENDPIGNIPRGYTADSRLARVIERAPLGTRRAVDLNDTSSSAIAALTHQDAAAAQRSWTFAVKPVSGMVMTDVLGTTATGAQVTAYHLGVWPDGSIHRYDGTSWSEVAPAGTVPQGAASTLRIEASTTGADVWVGSTRVAQGLAPSTAGATSITGYRFASSGTKTVGDHAILDDVSFR